MKKTALGAWRLVLGPTETGASRLTQPQAAPDLSHPAPSTNHQASEEHSDDEAPSLTPTQLAWRQLRKNWFAMAGGAILLLLYGLALFADFLSPYPPERQRRQLYYHPSTPIRWRDAEGRWLWRPHAMAMRRGADGRFVPDPSRMAPIRFCVRSDPYRFLGIIPMRLRLLGTDERVPLFLLGTDALGRDVFSRLLRGSQVSLSVGLLAIVITFSAGLIIGGVSGYYGGWVDNALMRLCEVLMSIPGFYLLLALAGVLPPTLPSHLTYLMIIVILSFVGWAGLARVIRGIALSVREREYVEAARALGISDFKIVLRHVLPSTFSYAIVSATLSIPAYILGEASLSFLGLGIREPMPSWGNMLSAAQSMEVLQNYWWILAPGFMIFITVMAYNFLGDGLRDALDPKLRR